MNYIRLDNTKYSNELIKAKVSKHSLLLEEEKINKH